MTLLLVTRSDLTTAIDDGFADVGVQASHVAGLIDPDLSVDGDVYRAAGRDLRPLLTQLVSSELDVDRMDYLLRDSYFTGVTYGRYDLDWLVAGLTHHEGEGGALHLALSERALFTFEDFLLSRLHMFVMVYFHHHTNMYDRMLVRFLEGLGDSARFPADPVAYCDQDDTRIWSLLREHRHDPWARRVLSKDPLKRVADLQDAEAGHRDTIDVELRARGMEPEWITSKGVLSRYWGRSDKARIFVLREALAGGRRAVPLENATDLFRRYSEPTVLVRVYVEPARQQEARGVVAGVIGA
jgi:HD superfamily phosphohydrolase